MSEIIQANVRLENPFVVISKLNQLRQIDEIKENTIETIADTIKEDNNYSKNSNLISLTKLLFNKGLLKSVDDPSKIYTTEETFLGYCFTFILLNDKGCLGGMLKLFDKEDKNCELEYLRVASCSGAPIYQINNSLEMKVSQIYRPKFTKVDKVYSSPKEVMAHILNIYSKYQK